MAYRIYTLSQHIVEHLRRRDGSTAENNHFYIPALCPVQQGKLPRLLLPNLATDIAPSNMYARESNDLDSDGNVSSHRCTECGSELLNQSPCPKFRWRLVLIPALLALLFIGVLAMVSCIGKFDLLGQSIGGILKRDENVFVRHKLYIIVLVVGAFLPLLLAISCSSFCCRAVFENPCCCPCYLCACCGGLACLDCLTCGIGG